MVLKSEPIKNTGKLIKLDSNLIIDYVDGLAGEAEVAAVKGNLRHLYSTTRKMAGKYN